jgi:hypothetical protein
LKSDYGRIEIHHQQSTDGDCSYLKSDYGRSNY